MTVIVASQLGLPVSSAHVALGGIFGVGFLREYFDQRMAKAVEDVLHSHQGDEHIAEVERMLYTFVNADAETKRDMLHQLSDMGHEAVITAAQRRKLKKALKRQQVRREHLFRIVSAWIITVPASALLSALFYFALRGMMI